MNGYYSELTCPHNSQLFHQQLILILVIPICMSVYTGDFYVCCLSVYTGDFYVCLLVCVHWWFLYLSACLCAPVISMSACLSVCTGDFYVCLLVCVHRWFLCLSACLCVPVMSVCLPVCTGECVCFGVYQWSYVCQLVCLCVLVFLTCICISDLMCVCLSVCVGFLWGWAINQLLWLVVSGKLWMSCCYV